MFKVTYTVFRPDTSTEFWHYLPEIQSWMQTMEDDMISRGLLISCNNSVSDDGLLFTRVTICQSQEAFNQMIALVHPTAYDQIRMEYNNANSHIFFSSEEVIT